MPDVTVTYTPNAPQAFTFSPDTVRMTGAGTVVLRRPAGVPWRFSAFDWCAPQPPPGAFTSTVTDDAVTIQDTFDHGAQDNGHFGYTVAIQPSPGTPAVWSPDPEVFNDYPTPTMHYLRTATPAGG
jgi:hypothetical protein